MSKKEICSYNDKNKYIKKTKYFISNNNCIELKSDLINKPIKNVHIVHGKEKGRYTGINSQAPNKMKSLPKLYKKYSS